MQYKMNAVTGEGKRSSAADSIAFLLPPLLYLYRQNIDKIVQPYGISAGQTTLLMLLAQKAGQNQKELLGQLNVKAPSLTTMLNRMEKTGLLERQKNEKDQRSCRIFLTDKGRRAVRKTQAVIRFVNERNLAGFRSEEKLLFLRLLEHMYGNLEKQRDELLLIKQEGRGKAAKH